MRSHTCDKENRYAFKGGKCQSCFPLSENSVYSKRKEFAPSGSEFFPFRVDTVSEGVYSKTKEFASIISLKSFSKAD